MKANLDWWNEVVGVHAHGDSYKLESFKAGMSRLKYLEGEEVGDVVGKSLLHLQCQFGFDILSWARLGASVTGVDFSETAIALARSLADEEALDATFVHSDLYDLPHALSAQFDIVYTSYGVIGWLPDLLPWAPSSPISSNQVASFILPKAIPSCGSSMIPPRISRWSTPTSHTKPSERRGSYADRSARMKHTVLYGWNHTFSEMFTSPLSAGLRIDFLHEFPFCAWDNFPEMALGEDKFNRMKDPYKEHMIPMTFSLKATRPV